MKYQIKYLIIMLFAFSYLAHGAAAKYQARQWEDMVVEQENRDRDVKDYIEQLRLKQEHAKKNDDANEILHLQDYLSGKKENKVEEVKKGLELTSLNYKNSDDKDDDAETKMIEYIKKADHNHKLKNSVNKLVVQFPKTAEFLRIAFEKANAQKGKKLKPVKIPLRSISDEILNEIMTYLKISPLRVEDPITISSGSTRFIIDMIKLNDKQLAILLADGRISVWNSDTNTKHSLLEADGKNMILLADGNIAVNRVDGKIAVLDYKNFKLLVSGKFEKSIDKINELNDGNLLLTTEDHRSIYFINPKKLEIISVIESISPIQSFLQLNSNEVALSLQTQEIVICNFKTEASRTIFTPRYNVEHFLKLKNGNILCACSDGVLRIWDSEMSNVINELSCQINKTHGGNCFNFVLEKSDEKIVVATSDGMIKIWKSLGDKNTCETYMCNLLTTMMIELSDGNIVIGTRDGFVATIDLNNLHKYQYAYIHKNTFASRNGVVKLIQLNDGRLVSILANTNFLGIFSPLLDINGTSKRGGSNCCCTIL